MGPFEMVFLIVLISVTGSLIGKALKLKQTSLDARLAGKGNVASDEALLREIAALRHRVAALETIVTDPGYELSRQIDKLDSRSRLAA